MDYFPSKDDESVTISCQNDKISGVLTYVPRSKGIIILASSSSSSRFNPRNILTAKILQKKNLSTLLIDLLTPVEESDNSLFNRFNIPLLSKRLSLTTKYIIKKSPGSLPIGYFGTNTITPTAFNTSINFKNRIKAIVSNGGRPDLSKEQLQNVYAPTLLLVGSNDSFLKVLNKRAYESLNCKKKFRVIHGTNYQLEEPHKLEETAEVSANWFIDKFTESDC